MVIDSMAQRVLQMIDEGTTTHEAVLWVTRKIHRNLRRHYEHHVLLQACRLVLRGMPVNDLLEGGKCSWHS